MTSAKRSSLRVKERRRRAHSRSIFPKILMLGAGGVAIAIMTTSAAMFGLKRMQGVAYAARADGSTSTPFGAVPSQLAWTVPVDARGNRMLVVAGLPVVETVRAAEAPDTFARDESEEEQ